jgi:hypothetical protein
MAYDTRTRFAEAIYDAAPYYRSMERKLNWLAPFDIDKAWGIYLRARRPSLGFAIIGRTVVDRVGPEGPVPPSAFGNAIDFVEHYNFGVNSEDAELADFTGFAFQPGHVGSICHFYKGAKSPGSCGWHFAYNDSWILGGVHSRLQFQIASPRRHANVWDDGNKEMGVTGRELCGLQTFGYRIVKTVYNEIAVCSNPTAANNATFGGYIEAIRRYNAKGVRAVADLIGV